MTDRDRGRVRIYVRKEDGLLLGAELLAPEGEHLAHLINWMIGCKLSAKDVLSMPFYHPTLEEGLRGAFRKALKQSSAEKPEFEMLRCEEGVLNDLGSAGDRS
jgi:dihydrolipoamide dehydrogenase